MAQLNLSMEVVSNTLTFLERVVDQLKTVPETFAFCEAYSTFQAIQRMQQQAVAAAKEAPQQGVPFAGIMPAAPPQQSNDTQSV